jgi:hypothetical protein
LPPRPVGPYVRFTVSTTVEELPALAPAASDAGHSIETYIERCRRRIPEFVSAHFSIRQTWDLQRPTLWFDLVCAPINSAWALPYLAVQKIAETVERIGYPKLARWAKRLPSGITTGYQREIGRRIRRDLLEWDQAESRKELSEAPALRKRIETLVHQFSSGRAIVSDLFGTLLTLAMSWVILGTMSLSLNDVAHGLARKSAHERAASRFFLGKKAGAAFYNVFPPAVHESTIWMALVFVVVVLTIGGMAGTILSDPIRKYLGFHRYRLEALLDELERELIILSHKAK